MPKIGRVKPLSIFQPALLYVESASSVAPVLPVKVPPVTPVELPLPTPVLVPEVAVSQKLLLIEPELLPINPPIAPPPDSVMEPVLYELVILAKFIPTKPPTEELALPEVIVTLPRLYESDIDPEPKIPTKPPTLSPVVLMT